MRTDFVFVLAVVSILSGCGQSGRNVTMAPVSGGVTLDRTPLQDGVIELFNTSNGFSVGTPIGFDGKFSIDRVPTGEYEVVVRPPYLPPPDETPPPRPATAGPIREIPKKYSDSTTSGYRVTVVAEGVKDVMFELKK